MRCLGCRRRKQTNERRTTKETSSRPDAKYTYLTTKRPTFNVQHFSKGEDMPTYHLPLTTYLPPTYLRIVRIRIRIRCCSHVYHPRFPSFFFLCSVFCVPFASVTYIHTCETYILLHLLFVFCAIQSNMLSNPTSASSCLVLSRLILNQSVRA